MDLPYYCYVPRYMSSGYYEVKTNCFIVGPSRDFGKGFACSIPPIHDFVDKSGMSTFAPVLLVMVFQIIRTTFSQRRSYGVTNR
jgi:hypothetical protein